MLTRDTVTHYVPYDDPARPRTRLAAICGAVIRRRDSVGQPTCPVCRQILADRDRDDDEHTSMLRLR